MAFFAFIHFRLKCINFKQKFIPKLPSFRSISIPSFHRILQHFDYIRHAITMLRRLFSQVLFLFNVSYRHSQPFSKMFIMISVYGSIKQIFIHYLKRSLVFVVIHILLWKHANGIFVERIVQFSVPYVLGLSRIIEFGISIREIIFLQIIHRSAFSLA
jgi:hypothetical protein